MRLPALDSANRPWLARAFWAVPLLALAFETDLTAILWLGGTALALLLFRDARQNTLRWVYRNVWISVGVGTVAGSLMGLILNPLIGSAAEAIAGSKIDLSQFAHVRGDTGAYFELLIVAMLFGGIVEEIGFRGFFIGWGGSLFGRRWDIPLMLIIAVIFGLGHIYQGVAGAIDSFVASMLFGAVYLVCDRRLLPAIVTHAVSNAFGVTAIYQGTI